MPTLSKADVAERKRERAGSLLTQARYQEAAIALSEARDEFARHDQPLDVANVAVDLAELYEWLGDFDRAREEASRTRPLIEPFLGGAAPSIDDAFTALAEGRLEQANDAAKLALVWQTLVQLEARVARNLGDYGAAGNLFRQIRGAVEPFVVPAIDFQLARIEVERGRVAEGLAALRSLEPRMTGLLRPRLGALLSWESEALLRLGEPADALPIARAAATELASYRDLDSLWRTQWRVARAIAGTGDKQAALAAYGEAVTTVTTLRRFPMGYRLESTFFAEKLPLFDEAIFLAAELRDTATCSRLMEQVKSRALTSMLTVTSVEKETGASGAASGELDSAADELSRQVDALEYQAYRTGWTDETAAQRDELLTQRTRLLERILLADARWRSLSRPAELDLQQVAASLERRNQAALTLYYRAGRVVALLVQHGSTQVEIQTLTEETIAAVTAYQQNLEGKSPDPGKFDPAGEPALAADRLLPAALLEQALSAEALVIVPHGPLHLLPWAAVRFGDQRLFERCAVAVMPNMSCVVVLEEQPTASPSIALLGAPSYQGLASINQLPLAAGEILTVAEIFGDRVIGRPLVGSEATQAAYRALLAEPAAAHGILHLACHGDLVAGDPENSGLLLDDGRLDVADIQRMKISFDEVVLSACASGYRPTRVRGIELAGDDIVGLPGAFLEAGARSVLVSIPPARDDAALDFMTRYYEHRAKGDPALRSLREAQLAMLAAGEYPAYLWAGFTLYGG
jgi:CHAT domain-containing protein